MRCLFLKWKQLEPSRQKVESLSCKLHGHPQLGDTHHSCEQLYSLRLLLGIEAQQLPTHLSSCRPPWLLRGIWELWLFPFKYSECLPVKVGKLWRGNALGTQNNLLLRWLWKLVLQPPRHATFSISLACWLQRLRLLSHVSCWEKYAVWDD